MAESYKLYYWSLKISTLKRNRKSTQRRMKKAGTKAKITDTNMTLQEAQAGRTTTREEMKLVLIKAKELRREELEKRAKAYAEAGNQVMEVVLQELINREKSKNS